MALRPQRSTLSFALFSALLTGLALVPACANSSSDGPNGSGGPDSNGDNVADDLGNLVDVDKDGKADTVDANMDGKADGFKLDRDGDGTPEAVGLDTDCDGLLDAIDTTGDGKADFFSGQAPPKSPSNCAPVGGSGGSGNTAGTNATGGNGMAGTSTGGTAVGGSGGSGPSQLGMGDYQGSGSSTEQYAESDLYRDGVGYKFIANGWGDNWQNHKISWNGTSFKVESFAGSVGANFSPAGYPTVFCGQYSNPPKTSIGTCGLPAAISSLQTVKTGWRWKANGNSGQYNAAWDIWLGNGGSLSSYLMVWLRDPPGQQPAGAAALAGATVPGLPGSWTIWTGNVQGIPIVNYVRSEGQDLGELEFDVMAIYKDALNRQYNLPGSQILSVAIGFEIWQGPVTNLVTEDFYVDVN